MKELLSEIYNIENCRISRKVENYAIINDNTIAIKFYMEDGHKHVNIYELAHKCKEWAYRNKYVISSGLSKATDDTIEYDCIIEHFNTYYCQEDKNAHKQFVSDTEQEAIFQACKWILERIKDERVS